MVNAISGWYADKARRCSTGGPCIAIRTWNEFSLSRDEGQAQKSFRWKRSTRVVLGIAGNGEIRSQRYRRGILQLRARRIGGRVDRSGYPPRSLTDPAVPNKGIRLFRSTASLRPSVSVHDPGLGKG